MSNTTTCSQCGEAYEEISEEEANAPGRLCGRCWAAGWRLDDWHNHYHVGTPCKACEGTGRLLKPAAPGSPLTVRIPCPACADV